MAAPWKQAFGPCGRGLLCLLLFVFFCLVFQNKLLAEEHALVGIYGPSSFPKWAWGGG